MHNAHTKIEWYNIINIFSNFVHNDDAEARGISVTQETGDGESVFDTTNCDATCTYLNETANCSCTRDDITGLIECFSDSVTNLTADIPITTTPAPTGQCNPFVPVHYIKICLGYRLSCDGVQKYVFRADTADS